jgi:hypothetical protein
MALPVLWLSSLSLEDIRPEQLTKSGCINLNTLAEFKVNKDFLSTKFLVVDPVNPATVWDKYNKLYQVYGDIPDSIKIVNRIRVVTFTTGLNVQSDNDNIGISRNESRYGGYMGIFTDAKVRKFFVDGKGEVHEIPPGNREPNF